VDSELERLIDQALGQRDQSHQKRHRRPVQHLSSTHLIIDGREYVNFSSNDYLGLAHHPALKQAIAGAIRSHGAGSGASALVTGYSEELASAELALAKWKQTQAAVILPSGYQANHTAVQTLAGAATSAGKEIRFLLDKLVHASLIDAVRGTEKPYRVFGHNDLEKLERLLTEADENQLQVVITESIFSMDGDAANLKGLVELKRELPFVLLLDEAHGSGVYGPNGSGYASEIGLTEDVDIFIVTLSKALGCMGGAICASKRFCDAVANFGRAYIYSTAVSPAIAAGCTSAIEIMRAEPERQQRVRSLAARVRSELAARGLAIPPRDSPIIPVIIGAEQLALDLAEKLREQGMIVLPVRPPTVPRGSSRLRITLSAAHSDEEVDRLVRFLISTQNEKPM
jgi:8-amino-7-oxononanoate synthase